MVNIKREHEIISYRYNDAIKEIFLRERKKADFTMKLGDKLIGTFKISKALRDILVDIGYDIKRVEGSHLRGIKTFAKCKIDVNKVMDGEDIKVLKIHVLGNSVDDAQAKAQILVNQVYKLCGKKNYHSELRSTVRC